MADQLVLVDQKVVLSPKEYNVLLAQVAARVANAYIARGNDTGVARDGVLIGKEILERSGIEVAQPAG